MSCHVFACLPSFPLSPPRPRVSFLPFPAQLTDLFYEFGEKPAVNLEDDGVEMVEEEEPAARPAPVVVTSSPSKKRRRGASDASEVVALLDSDDDDGF